MVKSHPKPEMTLQPNAFTVASYNIHKGVGTDYRRNPDRVAGVIGELGADILALQETDMRGGDRAGVLDLARLERETGLVPVPLGLRTGARAHGWHGNQLLLREADVHNVRQVTLPGFEPRGAIVADLTIRGRDLVVVASHFGLLRRSRREQAQTLATLRAEADDRPWLVMGDLNEWRKGRGCGLQPFGPGLRSAPRCATFPANFPVLALDRLLTDPRLEVLDVAAHRSPMARLASDHLPLRARVAFST
jgi:endonuclease/exonuclease/phosphatase family metal-dependent hydrolase